MIIAELCGNHNGDTDTLKEMVKQASEAGAKFAKIQSFFASDLTAQFRQDYDRIKKCELGVDGLARFTDYCHKFEITPMTTTYSFDICTELKRVGIKHVKIASPHARDSALIRKYLLAGFKVYVSTGGWNLREIPKLETVSCYMHTVSQYPSDPYKANISRMLEMKQWFPRVPYGFSDHTDPTHKKWDVPVKLALLCGASVIEKHFTVLDRDATKDGVVSIDKKQLEDIVNFSTLSTEDKLKAKPELGLYYYPQTEAEQKLVKKYEGRFKR